MSTRIVRTAMLAAVMLGAPAAAMASPDRPASTERAVSTKAPVPAAASAASSYAEREASDKQVAEFQGGYIEAGPGGTVVVISGAALFLVVVLLLLL